MKMNNASIDARNALRAIRRAFQACEVTVSDVEEYRKLMVTLITNLKIIEDSIAALDGNQIRIMTDENS